MTLNNDDFENVSKLIYYRSGLSFDQKRMYFVIKRIQQRMEALGIEQVSRYLTLLRADFEDRGEFQNLVNLLTTNESYFFRDYPQLESFATNCLPEVLQKKHENGDNILRIWSAGCSSGEEAYTLAIILLEMLDDVDSWKIQIFANDIDEIILEKAKSGVYEYRSIKDVPDEYLQKYFIHKDSHYLVKQEVKKLVTFELMNLNDQIAMRKMRFFDFVFCRNVLIYFDQTSRKRVIDNFYNSMSRGAYIFLGSSESIGRITAAFKLRRMGDYLVYSKE